MTTTSPKVAQPRRYHQFSLRLLLLGLTAFAIGFPIWYRWPFEETEIKYSGPDPFAAPSAAKIPEGKITRTWRRTWGGGKVQAGRTVAESTYGPTKTVEYIVNGKLHGRFESYLQGKLVRIGHYEKGLREGAWIDYADNATFTGHWRQDRLDGPFEIAYQDGRQQHYKFRNGRLTDVNGQPIKSRLQDQLESGAIDDPRIEEELSELMPIGVEFVETPLKDAIAFLQDQHMIPIVLDASRVTDIDRLVTLSVRGIDLCAALTLLTTSHDLAFEYRYGVLRLTTAENAADGRDLTGVSDFQPPPDSPLARAWNEPCSLQVSAWPLNASLQKLAQPLAISFDLSALPPEQQAMPLTMNLQLPLRHVLGLVLDKLDLRCEPRGGDTIVILPPKSPSAD